MLLEILVRAIKQEQKNIQNRQEYIKFLYEYDMLFYVEKPKDYQIKKINKLLSIAGGYTINIQKKNKKKEKNHLHFYSLATNNIKMKLRK